MTTALPARAVISAVGTGRRLGALTAIGWPDIDLAREIGIARKNLPRLRTGTLAVESARRVAAVYDRLWNVDPRTQGVSDYAYGRARARAQRRRWPGPLAWDDDTIDDPCAWPDWTGHCGTPRGYRAHHTHGLLPACEPCQDAAAAERRQRRQAKAVAA